MKNKDFYEQFRESTTTKLELFRGYVESWLPVFLNRPNRYSTIHIYDFFSGPGLDQVGNVGSPLIAINEIEKALQTNKDRLSSKLRIRLVLNDSDKKKVKCLRENIEKRDFKHSAVSVEVYDKPFAELFASEKPKMETNGTANLVFIDQFGISEITKEIFSSLVSIRSTDILFFTSSAIVNRMKDHPAIQSRIPLLSKDELTEMNGGNVHRILSRSYRRWLPPGNDYYLGDFSIRNGANVYGLVFGSSHIQGILKFLSVAWGLSETGDANYDIDGDQIDVSQPSLFGEFDRPSKIKEFESRLKKSIQKKQFRTNLDILRFTVENGMLPKHARKALKDAIETKALPQQSLVGLRDCWRNGKQRKIIYHGDIQ